MPRAIESRTVTKLDRSTRIRQTHFGLANEDCQEHESASLTSNTTIKRTHTRTNEFNLTGIQDDVTPANSQSFTYSATRRLQTAEGPWGNYGFYYDLVGNRVYVTRQVDGGPRVLSVHTYSQTDNRLTGIYDKKVRTFTYTANGNIATDTRDGTLYEYTWTHANRLRTVTVAGSLKATYTYNALEQQVVRTLTNMTPAGPFHSIYDRMGNLIAETDGLGNTVREYIWLRESADTVDRRGGGSTYVPLAVVDDVDTALPKLYFVHGDHLNRPIKMTDGTKASVWDAAWLPFGGAHSITGTASNSARFPGQWFRAESDLHYNWHRHYDPATGRYIKPDPLGLVDGPSVYGYAMNSPLVRVDLEGRVSFVIGIGGTGTAGVGADFSGGRILDHRGGDTIFATYGPSLGFNVSSDAFLGVFSGNVCDFSGRFVNYNLVLGPLSLSLMFSSRHLGFTVGFGPSALPAGASVSVTNTNLRKRMAPR